jgi:hypothetical protein
MSARRSVAPSTRMRLNLRPQIFFPGIPSALVRQLSSIRMATGSSIIKMGSQSALQQASPREMLLVRNREL